MNKLNTGKSITITAKEIQFFQENGYLIKRGFVDLKVLQNLQNTVLEHLNQRIKPYELEQEVNYPGSPKTQAEKGGDTIRRLRLAYTRDDVFKHWAENKNTIAIIKLLLQSKSLYLVQSHHNCIMTKQPQFSSETHWHKDIRYWNFENTNLVNTWLPLGDETIENGCLQVIPKTHLWNVSKDRLDDRLFLRKDLVENQQWLDKSIDVELQKGDLLFFHAAVFHAAGRNNTNKSKNTVVITYHSENNSPLKNTNSINYTEIEMLKCHD
ncbi:MAG: phytanoyl-CoA dioxygenase family protein [Alcanivoracaceae bacterium]|nr:phytanoyl-CoA dioxygenase family protein [Alcanivoracaceae bacterium]